ncbi:MAG: aspartyl protease family protein [Fimbriimonadales bacterium]
MHAFDPTENLVRTWGEAQLGDATVRLNLGVDTGCSQTILVGSAITTLTYNTGLGDPLRVVTAGGDITGYKLKLDRLSALSQDGFSYDVLVCDLPSSLGVDGLLGLDFYWGKHLHLDFENGFVDLEDPTWPASKGPAHNP